jgi:hypothetical protein
MDTNSFLLFVSIRGFSCALLIFEIWVAFGPQPEVRFELRLEPAHQKWLP